MLIPHHVIFLLVLILNWGLFYLMYTNRRQKKALFEFLYFFKKEHEYWVLVLNMASFIACLTISAIIWGASFKFFDYEIQSASKDFRPKSFETLIHGEFYFLTEYEGIEDSAAHQILINTTFSPFLNKDNTGRFKTVLSEYNKEDSLKFLYALVDGNYFDLLHKSRKSKNIYGFRIDKNEIQKYVVYKLNPNSQVSNLVLERFLMFSIIWIITHVLRLWYFQDLHSFNIRISDPFFTNRYSKMFQYYYLGLFASFGIFFLVVGTCIEYFQIAFAFIVMKIAVICYLFLALNMELLSILILVILFLYPLMFFYHYFFKFTEWKYNWLTLIFSGIPLENNLE